MKYLTTVLLLLLLGVSFAFSGTIKGIVTDKDTGDPLIGANVVLEGTGMGTTTDLDGFFIITDVPPGTYKLTVNYVGYDDFTREITVTDQPLSLQISMKATVYLGKEIVVLADRAKPRETPVAFTDVKKVEIVSRLGSQDIPLILNTTPGVYASAQGGGSGDSRINIRGFNQRNVAVMINGVPVNDMENGWVYWSNWDGLGDVTSSIQVQRGLSAVNLAVPSVGGTMNIITDPAAIKPGVIFKTEAGTANFAKRTLVANTGLINNKFAFSTAVVRKIGDGLIENTWTDAWAYYIGMSYIANKHHKFDFYAIGAPQRHGNNFYKRPIASYDHQYALDQGIPRDQVLATPELGRLYNATWGYVSRGTLEYWNGETHDPHDQGKLYARENYYHKPQINFNWYWNIKDNMDLTTVLYYSRGKGGGSGPKGSYIYTKDGHIDWDAMIEANTSPDRYDSTFGGYGASAIIRNSVNQHKWYGLISKLNYRPTENLKTMVGIDWRTFTGEHFREVRNLLGADFFYRTDNENWSESERYRKLGDIWNYHFDNKVNWLGAFAQAEYTSGKYTAYGTVGLSGVKYKHINYFKKKVGDDYPSLESDNIYGFTVKGGASYRFNKQTSIFANLGYLSKVPIFDNVIDDRTFTMNKNPKNEKIIGFEAGTDFRTKDGTLAVNANVYYTMWMDRGWSLTYTSENNITYFYNITGIDARHMGFELDGTWRPSKLLKVNGMASIGYWKWLNDVTSRFSPEDNPTEVQESTIYIKDLYVSDAPQTSFALEPTLYPFEGFSFTLTAKYFARYYADFDPTRRTDPNDRTQPWKVPSWAIFDMHINYLLPVNLKGVDLTLFAHVFNLFDTKYISDASDGYNHDAATARVFFGLPRTWNAGLTLSF